MLTFMVRPGPFYRKDLKLYDTGNTGNTRRELFVVVGKKKSEKSVDNQVINYGLTISMKNVSQHATQWKIVFADKVVVSTIELTKR